MADAKAAAEAIINTAAHNPAVKEEMKKILCGPPAADAGPAAVEGAAAAAVKLPAPPVAEGTAEPPAVVAEPPAEGTADPPAVVGDKPEGDQGGGRRSKRRRQKKSSKKSKKGGRSRKNSSKNRRKLSRRR